MYFYLILTATLLVVAGLAIALYRCRRRLRQCQQAMVRCINENIEMKEKLPEYELPHFLNREDITPEEFTRIIHNMLKRLMFLSVFFLLASCPMATQEKLLPACVMPHGDPRKGGDLDKPESFKLYYKWEFSSFTI